MSETTGPRGSIIRRLKISRFRGLKSFVWIPSGGMNIILGGGDAGKTTVLDAIALLFSPSANSSLSDTDYWLREVEEGFFIEAIVSVADSVCINNQRKQAWPWQWNGQEVAAVTNEGEPPGEAVYCFRVRGTADMELVHEVIQPDDSVETFSVALRRAIGTVRLSGDDANDRDLRLVQGSALDRVINDKSFRARVGHKMAEVDISGNLGADSKKALGELSTQFSGKALPSPLDLGLTSSPGYSLNALIGLTALKDGVNLPILEWGAGTRRWSALTIAGTLSGKAPITLIDEIERGLECYRQRSLVRELVAGGAQSFITTHSAAAIQAAATSASFWYLDLSGKIGALSGKTVKRRIDADPEAFLSRFTVVCEGITEVGFVSYLLENDFELPLADYGIHMTDSGGNESVLDILESLGESGLLFGGIADDENKSPDRWQKVKVLLGNRLLRWSNGCLEEAVFAFIPEDRIENFIRDPEDEHFGSRIRTLYDRLEMTGNCEWNAIKQQAGSDLRRYIKEAFLGKIPDKYKDNRAKKNEFKNHSQQWFKTIDGGRELAAKVVSLGVWPNLKAQLLPFLNSIREGVKATPISDLVHE